MGIKVYSSDNIFKFSLSSFFMQVNPAKMMKFRIYRDFDDDIIDYGN